MCMIKRGELKMDEYFKMNEPFKLVSHASQVFYVIDHSNKG